MALTRNPTKTKRIEQAWFRQINSRWSEFTKLAIGMLKETNKILVNKSDPFVLDASQQRVYMAFLVSQIERLLLGTATPPNWQAVHQLAAYRRGLESTRALLIAQGSGITPTAIEVLAAQGVTAFTATSSIGVSGFAPIHQEALEFLFERSYTSLKGWTDKMANETRQILFDAVEQGKGINEVTREITKRIDVSKSRAQTIARTEINQAFSRSSIAESIRASEEIGEEVKLRWLTAADSRVRHSHASVHGIVMTHERASKIKTTDGVNCRCALAPVIEESDTEVKREKFSKERKQLLELERKQKVAV